MKEIKRTFFLGIILFVFQMLYIFLWSLYKSFFDLITALKSTFGVGIYTIMYAFWAYFLFSYIFIIATMRMKNYWSKFPIAIAIMIVSYFLFRAGDIIDGDFIRKFNLTPLVGFLLTAPIMVLFDRIFQGRRNLTLKSD